MALRRGTGLVRIVLGGVTVAVGAAVGAVVGLLLAILIWIAAVEGGPEAPIAALPLIAVPTLGVTVGLGIAGALAVRDRVTARRDRPVA